MKKPGQFVAVVVTCLMLVSAVSVPRVVAEPAAGEPDGTMKPGTTIPGAGISTQAAEHTAALGTGISTPAAKDVSAPGISGPTTENTSAPGSVIPVDVLHISLADTNQFGHFPLLTFPGWQFSFEAPAAIRDQQNLSDTLPVRLQDFSEIKRDPRWKQYGWFELILNIDTELAGRSFLMNHRGHKPVRVWLNGVLVLENGNATADPDQEVLSRFINQKQTGIMFREGINYLLVEYSEHTAPRFFTHFSGPPNGIFLYLMPHYEPFQRRHRAFIFGGAFMLLGLLVFIHAYLAARFKDSYHIYVSLTTLSMLLLAFTTLSDTLFDWNYRYLYFYEFAYVTSVSAIAYFFLVSVRVIFNLSVNWTVLNILFIVCTSLAIAAVYIERTWLNILHPAMAIGTLIYVVVSLYRARKEDPDARIGVVAGGLIGTALGTMLYLIPYMSMGSTNHVLFYTSVIMTFTCIPVSLTFNVARNYADLIDTLEAKVEDRTADLALANAYQKRFFANISHEFRTPLTISEGLVSKLQKESNLSTAKVQYDLSVIRRNMGRLNDMVNQIIDLTKSEQNHLQLRRMYFKADALAAISVESFRSLAEHHGHSLVFLPDARHAVLHADRNKMEVVINNLISNAIKYTPDGGLITIETHATDNRFELIVRDNGPGIPAGMEETIFERFHRLSRPEEEYVEGMGVGLELSRTLARLHDGDVVAVPDVAEGAMFRLTVPLSATSDENLFELLEEEEERQLYQPEKLSQTEHAEHYSILLVEDNEDMMNYVSAILSELGTVERARNGGEALQLLSGYTPDLIITDLMMPVMGGQQLVETLTTRKKWADIPVVVLTARSLEEDKLHLLRTGVVDYIVKPFSNEQLLLKTRNLLQYYNRRKRLKVGIELDSTGPVAERLSDKIGTYITKNLSDVNLSVDTLAEEFSQSRSSLYRNVQLETGMSPAEFIREVRLTAARAMVSKNKHIRLDELAAAVGYRSATSFRKKYEERFGEHPLGD